MYSVMRGQKNFTIFVEILLKCQVTKTYFYLCMAQQGRSQPHRPGWTRFPLSSNFNQLDLFFLKTFSFSSSFWPPGGRIAHQGRPWLRYCGSIKPESRFFSLKSNKFHFPWNGIFVKKIIVSTKFVTKHLNSATVYIEYTI